MEKIDEVIFGVNGYFNSTSNMFGNPAYKVIPVWPDSNIEPSVRNTDEQNAYIEWKKRFGLKDDDDIKHNYTIFGDDESPF